MVDAPEGSREKFRSRWKRNFLTIWTGQAFSLFGSQLVQFALVWWLTFTTGSATVLALASIMALLPQVLFAPFAGVLVDQWKRRGVMIVADGLTALSTFVLVVLFAIGTVETWHIYIIMLFRSTFQSFHWPAMQAATTLMVPEEHLARIGGLNQALHGLASVLAPPLAAVLFILLPIHGILSIDILTALLAMLPLIFIRIPEPVMHEEVKRASIIMELREGIRFMRSWSGLMALIFIFMLVNLLLTPAITLTPILVLDHFHLGAIEFATMEAAVGIGMLAGGLALGVWGGSKRSVVGGFSALALMGLGTAVIGVVPSDGFAIAVGALLFVGLMLPIVNGSFIAVFQKTVPANMQGRVFSILGSLVTAASPLGLAVAGPVADTIGPQPWFLLAGVPMLILGVAAFFIPSLMNLEEAENGA